MWDIILHLIDVIILYCLFRLTNDVKIEEIVIYHEKSLQNEIHPYKKNEPKPRRLKRNKKLINYYF